MLQKLHQLVSEGVFLIGKEPVSMAGRGDDTPEFERLKAGIWHSAMADARLPDGF